MHACAGVAYEETKPYCNFVNDCTKYSSFSLFRLFRHAIVQFQMLLNDDFAHAGLKLARDFVGVGRMMKISGLSPCHTARS